MAPHLARSMLSAVLRWLAFVFRASHQKAWTFLQGKTLQAQPQQTASACSSPQHKCPPQLMYYSVPGPWRRTIMPAYPEEAFLLPDPKSVAYGEIYYISKGEYISTGSSAFIDRLISGDVVKYLKPNPYCPHREEESRLELEREAEAYRRIGKHARIPTLVDWDAASACLTLQYLENGDLGTYMTCHATEITAQQRNRWSEQAAETLVAVHAADIIHCDICPRNFWLDGKLNLYLGDFAGSSVAGSEAAAAADVRYRRPGLEGEPKYIDDVFALGCMLYFIQTGTEPFHEITEDEVQTRFEAVEFPDVSKLGCGDVIHSCWDGSLESAQRVLESLHELYDQ